MWHAVRVKQLDYPNSFKKIISLIYVILLNFRCNTDLMDNDLELCLVQGISYNVPNPKEIDTYVRFEFPWPNVSIALLVKLHSLISFMCFIGLRL